MKNKKLTTNEMLSRLTKQDIELLEKNGKLFLHKDHALPISRRDFLTTGLLTFSGVMMGPSVLNMFGQQALAQTVCSSANNLPANWPGFLHINVAGGYGMSGNFLAQKVLNKNLPLNLLNEAPNLADLADYRRVGLGLGRNSAAGSLNVSTTLFANKFPAVLPPAATPTVGGQVFQRISEVSTTGAKKTAVTSILVASMDDSSTNKFGPQGMILALLNKMSAKFQIYPHLSTSNSATNTGVNQVNAARDLRPMAPIIVDSAADVNNILGISNGGTETAENIIFSKEENSLSKELVDGVSKEQNRTLASTLSDLTDKFKSIFAEATSKNVDNVNCPAPVFDPFKHDDPTVAPQLAAVWTNVQNILNNANSNTGPNGNVIRNGTDAGGIATLVYSAVKGYAGSVGINLGGYDYHGRGRQNQDGADAKVGAIIGGALETAELLKKPLFIFVTSDGAVGANESDAPFQAFTSDRGIGGSCLMFMYHPTRNLADMDTQLGYFNDGNGAGDDTLVSSPERATTAAFYRYLKFAGISDWQIIAQDLLKDSSFTTAQLGYILGNGRV